MIIRYHKVDYLLARDLDYGGGEGTIGSFDLHH
jgi:hypothetical protein